LLEAETQKLLIASRNNVFWFMFEKVLPIAMIKKKYSATISDKKKCKTNLFHNSSILSYSKNPLLQKIMSPTKALKRLIGEILE